jgi:hypothetical protein
MDKFFCVLVALAMVLCGFFFLYNMFAPVFETLLTSLPL